MSDNQVNHAVTTMCRALEVSTSGYYAWRGRRPSARRLRDADLLVRVKASHEASRGTYGSPRILVDLREDGVRVSRKRLARLMKEADIQGVSRRKKRYTTVSGEGTQRFPDLVQRRFQASAPNQLWVADITYVPTHKGDLYLAVILDVFSRRIVGWAMRPHLRTELVAAALEMAVRSRQPGAGLVHHSDHGCQYTSLAFNHRCRAAGIDISMGSVGDCYDNAMCESFFATLECELIDRRSFVNHHHARRELFSFIEGFYNRSRRHSSIGYKSPIDFEADYHESAA